LTVSHESTNIDRTPPKNRTLIQEVLTCQLFSACQGLIFKTETDFLRNLFFNFIIKSLDTYRDSLDQYRDKVLFPDNFQVVIDSVNRHIAENRF
jgi:Mlc titration factor MtfA (ptsG expression regulator)